MRILFSTLAVLVLSNCATPTTTTPAVKPIEPNYDQIARETVAEVDTSAIKAAGW